MLKNLSKKSNNKGFTLVELLVVIAIIGILAVVAVPSLMKNMEKAKSAKLVSDFSAIKSAVMAEYADGTALVTGNLATNKIDVEDLSNQATYELEVTGNPVTHVELKLTASNPKILTHTKKQIGGDITGENSEILTISLIGSAESLEQEGQ